MVAFPTRAGEARREYVKDRLIGKKSKEESNYRQQQNLESKKSCAECKSYISQGQPFSACKTVAGVVRHDDICDFYS